MRGVPMWQLAGGTDDLANAYRHVPANDPRVTCVVLADPGTGGRDAVQSLPGDHHRDRSAAARGRVHSLLRRLCCRRAGRDGARRAAGAAEAAQPAGFPFLQGEIGRRQRDFHVPRGRERPLKLPLRRSDAERQRGARQPAARAVRRDPDVRPVFARVDRIAVRKAA
eukprot:2139669-Prymnesium_polylepis.1